MEGLAPEPEKEPARERLKRFGREKAEREPSPPVPLVLDRRSMIEKYLEGAQDGRL